MGKLEEITQQKLAQDALRRAEDAKRKSAEREHKQAEAARKKAEQLDKQNARQALVARLVPVIITQVLAQAEAQNIPGDGLLRFSTRIRQFMRERVALEDEQFAYWIIGSTSRRRENEHYILASNGRLGWRTAPDALETFTPNQVDVLGVMFYSLHGLIKTTTRDVMRSALDDPAFDDGFCMMVLNTTKAEVRSTLNPADPPTRPQQLRIWARKKWLRREWLRTTRW